MDLEKIEKIVLSQTEIEAASDKLVEVFLENREIVLLKKLLRDSFTVGANWAVCQIQRKQMLVKVEDVSDQEKVADL